MKLILSSVCNEVLENCRQGRRPASQAVSQGNTCLCSGDRPLAPTAGNFRTSPAFAM